MWYNDLLIILLGFVGLLMIVLTIIMASRMGQKKPAPIIEEKPEKIFIEKGFEGPEPEPEPEEEPEYETYYEEPSSTEPETIELEPEPIPEVDESEPEPEQEILEPVYYEPIDDEPEEPFDDVVITPIQPIIIVPNEEEPESADEDVVITPVEPIIIEPIEEALPVEEEPTLEESPMLEEESEGSLEETPEESYDSYIEPPEVEPSEDVLITPTETFFESTPEETTIDTPNPFDLPDDLQETVEPEPEPESEPEPEPVLDTIDEIEPEEPSIPEIDELPEIELPPIEADEPEEIEDEIEPDEIEEEPEPVVPVVEEKPSYRRKLRKPVIDESDPDLKLDLGVKTCPNCGSKVPDTIYCILCGKPLDPDNAIGYEEEKEEEG